MLPFWRLILIVCLVPSLSNAKKYMAYFGGGDSDNKTDEVFDDGFRSLISFSEQQKWESDFHYRSKIPEGVTSANGKSVKAFNTENFNRKISSLMRDIKSGKITSKDQVLVYLDSHGGRKEDGTFLIWSDRAAIDTSLLKKLIIEAEKKGVKLGIVAQACYSGTLLEYQSDNTCIISSSPWDRVGYSNDSSEFARIMKKNGGNSNLEEVFLDARQTAGAGTFTLSQPQISTSIGRKVNQLLSPLDVRIVGRPDRNKDFEKGICRNSNAGLAKIEKFYRDNKDKMLESYREQFASELKVLKDLVSDYDKVHLEIAKLRAEGDEKICPDKNEKNCRTNLKILLKVGGEKAQTIETHDPEMRQYTETKEFQRFFKSKIEFQKKYPGDKLQDLAAEISGVERGLFHKIYKAISSADPASNACRDFKL